ncbi:MAG: bifunctional ornithine acetyltransferase/N-acetylglutamate synthase [Nitrospirae bacterium]|nr:bifunctional ornithine acetyltransferase/N-acetylglutamate synthase [Nitrospirota bacterium]
MAAKLGPPPKPFRFAGISAGIKRNGRPDLALLWSPLPCAYAVAYTSNHVKAAHILWNERHLDPRRIHAVLVNSGNANAATGRKGVDDCSAIARSAERELGLRPGTVALASTGVIGHRLPVDKIQSSLPRLHSKLDTEGWSAFSKAIMTTDTRPKVSVRRLGLEAGLSTVMGFAKGAGMIGPRLIPYPPHAGQGRCGTWGRKVERNARPTHAPSATMLAFVASDARFASGELRSILARAIEESFNSIMVDGDMSTNDSVFLLSSGLAPVLPSEKDRVSGAIRGVLRDLALQIVSDGEGATKTVAIRVTQARNATSAEAVGRAIALSPLVKTALYGQDPNWGRILAAAGSTRSPIDPDRTTIRLNGIPLYIRGLPAGPTDLRRARLAVRRPQIEIEVSLGLGKAEKVVYTTDLSPRYVAINAAYD